MKARKLLDFILMPLLLFSFNSCKSRDIGIPKGIDCTLLLGKVEVNDVLVYEYETPDGQKKEIKLKKIETIKSGSYITNDFDVIGFTPDEKHTLQINVNPISGLVIIEHSRSITAPPKFILSNPDTVTIETITNGPVTKGKVVVEEPPSCRKMKVINILSVDQNEKQVEFEVENSKYASTYVFSTKYGFIKQELFKKKDSGDKEFLHRLVFVSFVEGNFSKRAREFGIK